MPVSLTCESAVWRCSSAAPPGNVASSWSCVPQEADIELTEIAARLVAEHEEPGGRAPAAEDSKLGRSRLHHAVGTASLADQPVAQSAGELVNGVFGQGVLTAHAAVRVGRVHR